MGQTLLCCLLASGCSPGFRRGDHHCVLVELAETGLGCHQHLGVEGFRKEGIFGHQGRWTGGSDYLPHLHVAHTVLGAR